MKRIFVIAFVILSVVCLAQDKKGTIKVKELDTVGFELTRSEVVLSEALDPTTMPSFPGGNAEMQKFLSKNIQYPAMEAEAGIQGKVYVAFVVDVDGSLTDIKLMRGVKDGPGCDKEAMRLVKMMPKWVPAKKEGKPVKTRINLPINFKIQ